MAGNGRRCRSRRDYAADVAHTVRARVLSPQDLMSRPDSGRLTALLKPRRGATEGGNGRSPIVECGSGRRWAHIEPWSTKCAPDGFRESLARFRADRPPHQPHVCRANPEPVFGPRGRLRGSDSTLGRHFDATLFPSSKRGHVGHRACRSATVKRGSSTTA
jgi:hypothetical protein